MCCSKHRSCDIYTQNLRGFGALAALSIQIIPLETYKRQLGSLKINQATNQTQSILSTDLIKYLTCARVQKTNNGKVGINS